MKCKQGDMALVVHSQSGNEGKVVTCLEYVKGPLVVNSDGYLYRLMPGDWWLIDRKINGCNYFSGIITENFMPYAPDENLIPINGIPDEESINDYLSSPVPVELV